MKISVGDQNKSTKEGVDTPGEQGIAPPGSSKRAPWDFLDIATRFSESVEGSGACGATAEAQDDSPGV